MPTRKSDGKQPDYSQAANSYAAYEYAKKHLIKIDPIYRAQVELLLKVLPYVAKEKVFALKGGTAINLFDRDLPRLSVDIDLTYTPFEDRETAFQGITASLKRIKQDIVAKVPGTHVVEQFPVPGSESDLKLICNNQAQVKIEVNPVIRGTLWPTRLMQVSKSVQDSFQMFTEMTVVSSGELYGGKICAALDRQHPRDIFDLRDFCPANKTILIGPDAITTEIRLGFLAALVGHKRPSHEMLNPRAKDQKQSFDSSFQGMANDLFSYKDFETTRNWLFSEVVNFLKHEDREFLISFTEGEPNWSLFPLPNLQDMPAVRWKLMNLQKFKKTRPADHAKLVKELASVLERHTK